jgi:hypothetical protein
MSPHLLVTKPLPPITILPSQSPSLSRPTKRLVSCDCVGERVDGRGALLLATATQPHSLAASPCVCCEAGGGRHGPVDEPD